MVINFIRHGMTEGNRFKRYIGVTDEELCGEGISALKGTEYPDCGVLVSSPMKRCIQTAEIIYPGRLPRVYSDFRECDFGIFEGKNYQELAGVPEYQKWIDGNATDRFPDGEDPFEFRKRCVLEFERMVSECPQTAEVSLVVHGGVIMAVLEKYAVPEQEFYKWHTENGHGYRTEFDGEKITVLEKI